MPRALHRVSLMAVCMVLLPSVTSTIAVAGSSPVSALHDDFRQVVGDQRNGPAPMSKDDIAGMEKALTVAESQQVCESAASLWAFATGVQAHAAQITELRDAPDRRWSPSELDSLNRGIAGFTRLGRDGAALRRGTLAALGDQTGCEGPVVVQVDPTRVTPMHGSLPGFESGTSRPVAGLIDSEGVQADFVEDELVVTTEDPARLEALLSRWGGQVIHILRSHQPEIPPQYLVRVETRYADPAGLSDNLGKLNDGKSKAESLTVSSEAGLRLLAAAAQEAASGDKALTVGVNWLTDPDGLADGSTNEAGTGPPGFNNVPTTPYSNDAYDWSYLNSGSAQDIGVTSAWSLLEPLGKLDNEVSIALLDKGFAAPVNGDLPPVTLLTSVPPLMLIPPDNPAPNGDPWHGTAVASAAAAVPDNFRGGAGPAGPVARLNLIYSGPDYFTGMLGIERALLFGTRIISMSFTGRVPWPLAWTVLLFDGYTALARNVSGALLFAGAGNDGESVDKETCFIGCWEKHWHTPCENAGVRCVGGLDRNSRNRHEFSNWGSEDVDIFAPFHVVIGPDPAHPEPYQARLFSGTSAATPFAAGVAALVWASNPSLSTGEVEDILLRNRRDSSDPEVKKRVIHAYGAVRDALTAMVHIQTPNDGDILPAHTPTVFTATTYDDGHGTPSVTWRVDGNVAAVGHTVSFLPSPGPHTVTATASFADATTATDSIQVTVHNYPPTVHISSPANNGTGIPSFGQTEPIQFHASSLDDAGPLAENQVRWHLDGSPVPFATGHNPTVALDTTLGDHSIAFVGCDNFGVCAIDSVTINVQPDGVNLPPQVSITNPIAGSLHWVNGIDVNGPYLDITLASEVFDPEGGPLTLTWFDNGVQLATGAGPTVRIYGDCGDGWHHLVLRVTDDAGNTRDDAVDFGVGVLC